MIKDTFRAIFIILIGMVLVPCMALVRVYQIVRDELRKESL